MPHIGVSSDVVADIRVGDSRSATAIGGEKNSFSNFKFLLHLSGMEMYKTMLHEYSTILFTNYSWLILGKTLLQDRAKFRPKINVFYMG